MEIKIVIPSKGKAKAITTNKHVANTIVCVSESELPEYKKYNPDQEYVTHSDNLIGLAKKRNWIYHKFKKVFMMDDDLFGLSRMTQKAGETSRIKPDLAYDIIQNAGNIANMMGCYLFSFNRYVVPEHYTGHQPFQMSGVVNGCGVGLLGQGLEKLFFAENIVGSGDFFISGLNAHYYRIVTGKQIGRAHV